MNNIELIKLKVGYTFKNIFGELIIFTDSTESPILTNSSNLDTTKITIGIVLYKKEHKTYIYIDDNNYFVINKI